MELLGEIEDIESVKKLVRNVTKPARDRLKDSLSSAYNISETPDSRNDWLRNLLLGTAKDVFVIANNHKVLFLYKDSDEPDGDKYYLRWEKDAMNFEKIASETITAVLCLPMRNKDGGGWICTVVGTCKGYVRFFTDHGCLLVEQKFSDNSIKGLSYQFSNFHNGMIVVYEDILVLVDSVGLCQILNGGRNQAAKALYRSNIVLGNLVGRKLRLPDCNQINCCVILGKLSNFGLNSLATDASAPSQQNGLIVCGIQPFVGFYTDPVDNSVLIDSTAVLVATAVKSALFGATSNFFNLANTGDEQEDLPIVLKTSFTIADRRREGECMVVSPDGSLSAIADNFGRVCLVDNTTGVIVRLWKGYRDAELSWICVNENFAISQSESVTRNSLYLVIHAPRRGLIEVWHMVHGQKVTTFIVKKWSKLLYCNQASLGSSQARSTCLVIEPDGVLRLVKTSLPYMVVPSANSEQADWVFLSKVKSAVADKSFSADLAQLILDIRDIKTFKVGVKLFELLVDNDSRIDADVVSKALDAFVVNSDWEPSEVEYIDNLRRLVFDYCQLLKNSATTALFNRSNRENSGEIPGLLDVDDAESVLRICQELSKTQSFEVRFVQKKLMSLAEFVGHFGGDQPIEQKDNSDLGAFVFGFMLDDEHDISLEVIDKTWAIMQDLGVDSNLCLSMVISNWLSLDRVGLTDGMIVNLGLLLDSILTTVPKKFIEMCGNFLSKSTNIAKGYTFALVAKKVLKKKFEMSAEWEEISIRFENWSLLCKSLKQILYLQYFSHVCELELPRLSLDSFKVQDVSRYLSCWVIKQGVNWKELISGKCPDNFEPELWEQIKVCLDGLQMWFPDSFYPDIIALECSVVSILNWEDNVEQLQYLKDCLQWLGDVSDVRLTRVAASYIWDKHVMSVFEILALLIEKVGKPPKDRLCRKDVKIGENDLETFLQLCTALLERTVSSEADRSYDNSIVTFSLTPNNVHLNELKTYPSPVYEQVELHLILAMITQSVITFSLKSVKVVTLIGQSARSSLFKCLSSEPITPLFSLQDTNLQKIRMDYLLKATNAIVVGISESGAISSQARANHWYGKLLDLALDWSCDMDTLRKQYVCALYSYGHDTVAEEIVPSISDKSGLGSSLLMVAGQRFGNYLLNNETMVHHNLARLPSSLSQWLKQIDSSTLKCKQCSLESVSVLVRTAISCLKEDSFDMRLANTLSETLQSL